MTELEKYELVNNSQTVEELKDAVNKIGDIPISSGCMWGSEKMTNNIQCIYEGLCIFNNVTRKYGIRQQLMYIMYYENDKL